MPADALQSGSGGRAPPTAAAADQQQQVAAALPAAVNGSSDSTPLAVDRYEEDRLHYADLPLGLLQPTVLPHGTAAASPLTAGRRRYLCYFMHRHLELRLPEVESVADLATEEAKSSPAAGSSSGEGPAVVWEMPFGDRPESPFWYVHLQSEEVARAVSSRSLLSKALVEVWGEGATLEELQQSIAAFPAEERAKWTGPEQSFKVVVEGWGCTHSQAQQVELIDSLEECTAFEGPIDLRTPQNRFWLIVVNSNGRGLPLLPDRYYFGREVGAGDRSVLHTYDLRRRRYLGPTSMDTEMAFLMCNLAKVRRSHIVYDPFVGTGSILIPAAHLGAMTLGSDIDIRVIKIGKKDKAGLQVNVWTNFRDYGLPPPLGLLRCDLHTAPFRSDLRGPLDAIVCDPPYGVRAGGKKSVAKDREIRNVDTYIASTDPYTMAECLHDLLECAARLLRVGGRLVYFMPSAPGFYHEEEVPRHPALQMVANCEQMLTTRYSRRLITMEKVKSYDEDEAAAYFAQRGPPKMAIDDMHDYIYKTPAELAAEAGITLEEQRAQQAARIPKNRSKNV